MLKALTLDGKRTNRKWSCHTHPTRSRRCDRTRSDFRVNVGVSIRTSLRLLNGVGVPDMRSANGIQCILVVESGDRTGQLTLDSCVVFW